MEHVKATVKLTKHADIAMHQFPAPILLDLTDAEHFYQAFIHEIRQHFSADKLMLLLLNALVFTLYLNSGQRQLTLRKANHLTVEKWLKEEVYPAVKTRVETYSV